MAEFIGVRILEEKTLWQRTIQKKKQLYCLELLYALISSFVNSMNMLKILMNCSESDSFYQLEYIETYKGGMGMTFFTVSLSANCLPVKRRHQ